MPMKSSVTQQDTTLTHHLAHVDVLKSWKLSLLRIQTHHGNIADKLLAGVQSYPPAITRLWGPFSPHPRLTPRELHPSLWSHSAIKQHIRPGKPAKPWPWWSECKNAPNFRKARISPTAGKGSFPCSETLLPPRLRPTAVLGLPQAPCHYHRIKNKNWQCQFLLGRDNKGVFKALELFDHNPFLDPGLRRVCLYSFCPLKAAFW